MSLISLTSAALSIFVATAGARVTSKGGYGNQYHASRNDVGSFGWGESMYANDLCREERQPVVEYYYLNDTKYLFFSQRVTWEEAGMLCETYNAKLAILDDMQKATAVAKAISDSNILMEDTWLGGRRVENVWTWFRGDAGSDRNTEIPVQPDLQDYPPWTREPSRRTKECLAIDRRAHSHPNFIDLDCRLRRPFICEQQPEDGSGKPVPSKWIRFNKYTYVLYHARVDWHEAAGYCRSLGGRLAVVRSPIMVDVLANSMTKTRPDFEAVWIGAHYSYGQWVWMPTGTTLSPITDSTGYPPWKRGTPEANEGCLLLDRHFDDVASFEEAACDRKRDFVCEEYPDDEEDEWMNVPVKFTHEGTVYTVYPVQRSWEESRDFCAERGSVLAYVDDMNATRSIVDAMGDHPKEISHVWIGGLMHDEREEWRWMPSGRRITARKDSSGFPPWTSLNEHLDYQAGRSRCLNLDRSDHTRPHMYGLDCEVKQSFVCAISCDVAPPVGNGNWTCDNDTRTGDKDCWLECAKGFVAMGVRNVSCSQESGWTTNRNWLEVPTCLAPKEYAARMIRSLSRELQNSVGYYFILDHLNERMRNLSLLFADRILNVFPISPNVRMGVTCLVTSPPIHIPFDRTNNCEMIGVIDALRKSVAKGDQGLQINPGILYRDLWSYRGRKSLVIAVIDSQRGRKYANVLKELTVQGKQVVVVGLAEDWRFLHPLGRSGTDASRNVYLLDVGEFESILSELRNTKRKDAKCAPQQSPEAVYKKHGESTDTMSLRIFEQEHVPTTDTTEVNGGDFATRRTTYTSFSPATIADVEGGTTTPVSPFPKVYMSKNYTTYKATTDEISKGN